MIDLITLINPFLLALLTFWIWNLKDGCSDARNLKTNCEKIACGYIMM